MKNKTVLFVLLDAFADWEASFLAPALRAGVMPGRPGSCEVRYAAPEGRPVRSIGGLTAVPDCDLSLLPPDCAALILIGGMSWNTPAAEAVAPLVRDALSRGILVGGICNAVSFLAAHGFLNGVRHTGNTLEMLQAWGGDRYTGAALYEERQAVRDGGIVTANGSGYLEFARECLIGLEADTPAWIEASYDFNKHGFYSGRNGGSRTVHP